MREDLALELLRQLELRLDEFEMARDLTEDEARARWREVGLPMADFENAAGRLSNEGEQMQNDQGSLAADLRPSASAVVDEPDDENGQCKVEGCENPSAAARGRYAGLCLEHREEKKAEIGVPRAEKPRTEKPKADPTQAQFRQLDEMRDLLRDLVMLDNDDIDLDAVRIEAARILLRP